jgi:cytochrome c-type biogenesis protein CcmF
VRTRRSGTGETWPRAALRLVAYNRRRYGGYLAHAGIVLLFVGVAASSAFMDQRDVRLKPGETAQVGSSTVTYREPEVRAFDDRAGTGAALSFGAVIEVERGGKHYVFHPSHNLYQSRNPDAGAFSSFFDGESTSEVALSWGLQRDVWTAIQPDLSRLQRPIAMADKRFADADPATKGQIIAAIQQMYVVTQPAATFRVIIFPFVSWIWIGGALLLFGAAIAMRRPPRPRGEKARVPSRKRGKASRPVPARQTA